jgi:hypothetical protein
MELEMIAFGSANRLSRMTVLQYPAGPMERHEAEGSAQARPGQARPQAVVLKPFEPFEGEICFI